MSEAVTASEEFLKKFTRELPVELTEAELQSYGRMLADKVNEEKIAEDAAKEENARRRAAIKIVSQEVARLAAARASGKELRGVLCGERLHGNVIEIVRLDTKTVVDTRPASLSDLQVHMPFDASTPSAPDVDEGRDNVIPFERPSEEPTGVMVESSTGDAVYAGAPDDRDPEVEADFAAPIAETAGDGEDLEVYEGDDPTDTAEAPNGEQSIVEAVGAGEPDLSDDEIDRKLEERAAWQEEEKKGKPVRERSKKANESKKTTASKKTKRK